MFSKAKKGELSNTTTTEYWNINIKIDSEYEDKYNKIIAYYNETLEKAPSKADVLRNAINHIYGEIYGTDTND